MVNALAVFVALFVLDLLYARYMPAVTEGRIVPAGLYAAGIIACSGYAAVNYVNDPWMLLPAMAGAFAGTAAGMIKWRS